MAANNTRRVAGVASIAVDGQPYDLMSDLVYGVSTVTRETKAGMSDVFGYSEMPKAGFISGKLMDNGALTIGEFNQMTFSNVQIELANGKLVVATNAWCTAEIEGNAAEGTFDVKFESNDVSEITAS